MSPWRALLNEWRTHRRQALVFLALGVLSTPQLYVVITNDNRPLNAIRALSISSEPRPFTNRTRAGGYRDSTMRLGVPTQEGDIRWYVMDRHVRQRISAPHRAIIPYFKLLYSGWAINPAIVQEGLRKVMCHGGPFARVLEIEEPVTTFHFAIGDLDGRHFKLEMTCPVPSN